MSFPVSLKAGGRSGIISVRMFLSIAFLLLSLSAATQDLFLSGIVFDSQGGVLSDAEIVLEHTTDRARWQAQTDAAGAFRFDRLAKGSYRVVVTKAGFFALVTEVDLESSKSLEVTLAPYERRTDEIEVIARPTPINLDVVSNQQNVDEQQIQTLPYTGRRNFLNALALMPGVLRDNFGRLHINGSRSDQLRYQLDGINVTDPSTGALAANIPIDAIENVDLDLAGYSAEFGKGSGGVVRVHTRFLSNRFRWDVTDFVPGVNFRHWAIGEWSPRLLLSGPLVQEKFWFLYSGSLRFVQTFNEDLPEGDNRQNETLGDQLVKLQWNLRESHVLALNLLNNSEYFGNLGLNRLRPREATTNFLRRSTTVAISDRNVVRGTVLETVFQWTHRRESDLAKGDDPLEVRPAGWRGHFFTDIRGRSERLRASQTVAWERTWLGRAHRFKAGGEFDDVRIDQRIDRRSFNLFTARGVLRMHVDFQGRPTAEARNREYGLFFQDRITINPKTQVEAGLRLDRERVVGRTNVSPRMAFSYLPFGSDRTKISGGIGVFYDNVALLNLLLPQLQRRINTLYRADGLSIERVSAPMSIRVHPALENPNGVHWNLSWENQWLSRWVTRINILEKRGRQQIRFASASTEGGFDLVLNNSGNSHYRGVELSLDRPVRTNLRFLASYMYSRTNARPSLSFDFPDPAVDRIPSAPVDWDARHRWISWGYFPFLFGSAMSYALEFRSGFPFTVVDELSHVVGPYNGRRFPAFFTISFNIEREFPFAFGRHLALRAGVNNALNHFNPRFVDSNIDSPTFLRFSDSSGRAFVGRVRLVKK